MQEMNYGNENDVDSHNTIIEVLHSTEAIHNSAAVYQQTVIPQPVRKNNQSTL
jgi:hypothetical protein